MGARKYAPRRSGRSGGRGSLRHRPHLGLTTIPAPLVGGALGGLLYRWLSEEPSEQITGTTKAVLS